MTDAEMSLARWSAENATALSPDPSGSTRWPIAVCWVAWIGLSLGAWALIFSLFLR
jgi:hypothetical protein